MQDLVDLRDLPPQLARAAMRRSLRNSRTAFIVLLRSCHFLAAFPNNDVVKGSCADGRRQHDIRCSSRLSGRTCLNNKGDAFSHALFAGSERRSTREIMRPEHCIACTKSSSLMFCCQIGISGEQGRADKLLKK